MKDKKISIKEILPIAILLVLIGVIVVILLSRENIIGTQKDDAPPAKSRSFSGFFNEESVGYELYFDTACMMYDYSGMSEAKFEALGDDVEAKILYYHKLFNVYNEYNGVVNLATINSRAGEGPIKVSRELYDFLEYAISVYSLTGGEMNIAMGRVLAIWHEYRENAIVFGLNQVPSADELAAAYEHCSIEDIVLDPEQMTVELCDPEMRLDVGAIGKGYAAEMIARMIEERGIKGVVLDLGGNLRAIGSKPSGEGWKTGIRNPDTTSSEKYIKKIDIKNTSVVTSGNYERYYMVDGVRYHHIIDKDTLMPAAYFSSVTVITKNSGLADGLSTALFCMSYEDGMAVIESVRAGGVSIKVVWVTVDGRVIEE